MWGTSLYCIMYIPNSIQLLIGLVTAQKTYLVLEHGELLEQVVNRALVIVGHRLLDIEREPLLDAAQSGSQSQVGEQQQIQAYGRGEYGVAAQEIDLNLHGIVHPAEYVNVIPALLVVLTGRIVVDLDLMIYIGIKFRIFILLQYPLYR